MSLVKRIKYVSVIVLLAAICIGIVKSTLGVFGGRQRFKELENEVFSLKSEKIQLEESIKYKETSEFIEEKARNELNMIKPGEKVYVISSPDSLIRVNKSVLSEKNDRSYLNNSRKDDNDPNWYMWYKLFF